MSKKALVVDDEKAIVKGIKFSLEQDDIVVTVLTMDRKRWIWPNPMITT